MLKIPWNPLREMSRDQLTSFRNRSIQDHHPSLNKSIMAQPLVTSHLDREEPRHSAVREYINNTLATLVRELSLCPADAHPSITLRHRANSTAFIINPINGALEASPGLEIYKTYSWPGKTSVEAWKFSMIFTRSTGTYLDL
jgi:hypothetical protein